VVSRRRRSRPQLAMQCLRSVVLRPRNMVTARDGYTAAARRRNINLFVPARLLRNRGAKRKRQASTAFKALLRMSSERLTLRSRAAVASVSSSQGSSRSATSSVRCLTSERLRESRLASEVAVSMRVYPFHMLHVWSNPRAHDRSWQQLWRLLRRSPGAHPLSKYDCKLASCGGGAPIC
jgi:hypothetical protein